MALFRFRIDAILLVALVVLAQVAVAVALQFSISNLSSTIEANEPTLSYASDGGLYYSGAHYGGDGTLWKASSDSSSFTQQGDPPTTGGVDAIIHVGVGGVLLWAEGNGTLALHTAVNDGGTWYQTNFDEGDRPWFATNSSGTFLVFTTGQPSHRWVELWKYVPSSHSWSSLYGQSNPVSDYNLAIGFINGTDGTLYVSTRDASGNIGVSSLSPGGSSWTASGTFAVSSDSDSFGLGGITLDSSSTLYFAYGSHDGSHYAI